MLVAIVLQVITPHTGRLRFWWVFPVLELAALVAVIVRDPGHIDRRTRAARRTTPRADRLAHRRDPESLVVLALDIVDKSTQASARRRCWAWRRAVGDQRRGVASGTGRWFVAGRRTPAAGSEVPPSFGFPGRRSRAGPRMDPRYADYLPVVHNATACGPTDTAHEDLGEMTMMVESVISLITTILDRAAMNVLPG